MDNSETFGNRLLLERKRFKLNQEQLGVIGNVSARTQGKYERGESRPDVDYLEAIASYNFDMNYLINGTRSSYIQPKSDNSNPKALAGLEKENSNRKPVSDLDGDNSNLQALAGLEKEHSNVQALAHLNDDFVLVPRYDVNASAGHGSVIHSEQIVDHLAFKREWVRKDLGLNPDKLALINAVGDSMEPAILSSDLLLVDLANNTLTDDAIYVLSVNGSLLVKRIQRMLNGSVAIKSDNPIYDNQTLQESELSDLRVLGRVVWFGRSM